MLTCWIAGYTTYKTDGLEFRLKDRVEFAEYFENAPPTRKYFEKLDLTKNFRGECNFYNVSEYLNGRSTNVPASEIDSSCYTKHLPNSKTLFIWGDSHAQQLYSGLRKELPKTWEILQVVSSGCPASLDATQPSTTDYCAQSNWFALKQIKNLQPDVVIIGQNEKHDEIKLRHIFMALRNAGVERVIFTGPTPHWTVDLPKTIMKSLWVSTPKFTRQGLDISVIERNAKLMNKIANSGAIYADIINVFCKSEGCMTYLGDDIKTGITSWDYGHLTPIASEYLAKKLLVELVTGEPATTN